VNILPRKEEDIPRGRHKICVVKLFKEGFRHGFYTHHQEGNKRIPNTTP
jgi:hypothetical protein